MMCDLFNLSIYLSMCVCVFVRVRVCMCVCVYVNTLLLFYAYSTGILFLIQISDPFYITLPCPLEETEYTSTQSPKEG